MTVDRWYVVCVTGSREATSWDFETFMVPRFEAHLTAARSVNRALVLVHGAARGADTLSEQWSGWNRVVRVPCLWDVGDSGPRRNSEMGDVCAALRSCGAWLYGEAFPCPESRGTWHMVGVFGALNVPSATTLIGGKQ